MTSSVLYYSADARKNEIYLLNSFAVRAKIARYGGSNCVSSGTSARIHGNESIMLLFCYLYDNDTLTQILAEMEECCSFCNL